MGMAPLDPSRARSSILLLCAICFLLGIRAQHSVRGVLSLRSIDAAPVDIAAGQDPLLRALAAEDSLLRTASAFGRDPFRFSRGDEGDGGPDGAGAGRGEPVLRAMLDDRIDPVAQIEVRGEGSPWLRAGDEFMGWTVEEVGSHGVWASRGGRRVYLPAR